MGYLYLNFLENMNQGSKSWDDFYTSSLKEQYEVIKRKVGLNVNLQEFLSYAFPTQTSKNYYISTPSFDRRIKQDRRGKDVIYNIVIRPEKDSYLNNVVPNNYDLMIVGDVTFNNVIDITVKGIELIDINVAKFGEIKVNCYAATATTTKSFTTRDGRSVTVPDYGTRDLQSAVLTYDFVDRLCNDISSYPVPNPEEALNTFQNWQNYINFRKYFLGKQSERCEEIDDVIVCDSFMVSKETYRRNEDVFSDYLLDDIADFARGEQIILSKNVNGSESFPLIRVDINKNRKTVLSETIGKSGKGKSRYEVNLQRYTKDAMGLSPTPPAYDENGNIAKGSRFYQYLLGERYLLTHIDIEPDCTELEKEFDKNCKNAFNEIDTRYSSIISNDLNHFMNGQRPITENQYNSMFDKYAEELNNALDLDVENNKDREVKREYEAALKNAATPFENEIKKINSSFDDKVKKIKKEKSKEKDEKKKIDELQKEKDSEIKRIELEKETALSNISLKDFYVERNKKLIENKKKSLSIQMQAELDKISKDKKKQLEIQYKNQIEDEKTDANSKFRKQFEADKAIKIENETIRRYQIYFRPDTVEDKLSNIKKEIEAINAQYLTYDNRAEKAKIDRQEKALNSFMGGYVKNPFLPTYLFSPKTLAQAPISAMKDPDWCLESLNDGQKLAVKKALASESIFLLQGPPGTGKTQVIAEITAQLARQGKKVLISSETHKAIDNVFERLPKIPEIRPLRLIPSQNGKETNYSPERLVDNFYLNISGNLEKQINRFEHFEEAKKTFDEQMSLLRRDYDRILRLKKENIQIENQRNGLLETINKYNKNLEDYRDNLATINAELDEYRRTNKYIDSLRFVTEGVKEQYIDEFKNRIQSLLQTFSSLASVNIDSAFELYHLDIGEVRNELSHILSDDTVGKLEERRTQLRNELQKLRDPDTDEAPEEGDENYDEYKKYQSELKEVVNQIKSATKNTDFDFSSSKIYAIVPSIINDKNLLKVLPEQLTSFKIQAQTIINEIKENVDISINKYSSQYDDLNSKMIDIQREISQSKSLYEELGNNQGIEEYNELNSQLKQKITRFFRDFDIIREYDSDNLETAFTIITEEWNKLEYDYKRTAAQNKKKIPMYKEICKYLEQEDILEEDRQAYTRELYNCVNVFGITCTSRDRFTKSQLAELERYGIESVDIKSQGIDVVIIDEVSKSSFLDLLIPILYGKTVILVGDHRQLPPMYDLRHMRKEDFEGLDEDVITKEINDSYTELYEECFFKTLYEKVPQDFRVMLNKQYRCHSHIMEVFNHFYGGSQKGLMVGKKQQDDEKQHNLTVKINGNTIIEPKYHVYFIDCDQKESSAYEGSTSKVNEQEAQVAIQLLKQIDKASIDAVNSGKVIVNKSKKIDERLSAGIICTYGDQASLIKKMRRGQRYEGLSEKQDERLIISTVDDFQGDERDVIILSMVRNPANAEKANAEFIKKFERINVALSRARKLLIVVGSKKYLSEAGIIDLPDLTGDHFLDKKNFHVYKEIIDTIYFRGKVLTANDIIGE